MKLGRRQTASALAEPVAPFPTDPHPIASKPMAVRPLIRPRPRVTAPTESLEGLPRVISRVGECAGASEQEETRAALRQPLAIRPKLSVTAATNSLLPTAPPAETKPVVSKPTLPAFWQSRKVIIAAGIMALVTAVSIGYQFRPKQQIIVVHPAKQPAAVATSPAVNTAAPKPAFQPLSPATSPVSVSKETTSTASLMPRATWPAEKNPAATPSKVATPQIQTATKPIDTRTSLMTPSASTPTQENLPRMSPQFPQTPNPAATSASNAAVVYNPMMNASASPLASNYANPHNSTPQNGVTSPNGYAPTYTASLPNYQPNMQPSQPQASSDGSFGAYGGARFEGQIQPLPLRR